MIIKYTYKHLKDEDYQHKVFKIDEIEEGKSKEYTHFMKKDGYALINRSLEKR